MINHLERIAFLDGQILTDVHLNKMQKNIAESLKDKTTRERYDMLMLVSPYNYYTYDSFIDESKKDNLSTAKLDNLRYMISEDEWIAKIVELPEQSEEAYILSDYEKDQNNESSIDFYYRISEGNEWTKVEADTPIYMPRTSYFQLKIHCRYEGSTRPAVYDYAVMFK